MKASEFRELTEKDMLKRLTELREELFNLKFSLATGQLDNYRRVRDVRKDIARLETVVHETMAAGKGNSAKQQADNDKAGTKKVRKILRKGKNSGEGS